ncbi:hypothetical protein GJ496_005519 [Pomphorhynchus laevis]|nr:hypothetical protein GJ496_005519 [Pomphorhynchus laevis]
MATCFTHIQGGARTIAKWSFGYLLVIFTCLFIVLNKAASIKSVFDGFDLLLKPRWHNLLNFQSWYMSASSIIHSTSIGTGVFIAFTSYAGENATHLKYTAYTIAIYDFVLSLILAIITSFTTFTFDTGDLISTDSNGVLQLYKIVYFFLDKAQYGSIFLVVYSLLFLLLGSTTIFLTMEAIYSAISEQIKYLRVNPVNGRLIVVNIMASLAIPTVICKGNVVTEFINLPDHRNIIVPIIILVEVVACIVNFKQFLVKIKVEDHEFPGRYLKLCWTVVVPLLTITYLIKIMSSIQDDKAALMHMCINLFIFLPTALYFIYYYVIKFVDVKSMLLKFQLHI